MGSVRPRVLLIPPQIPLIWWGSSHHILLEYSFAWDMNQFTSGGDDFLSISISDFYHVCWKICRWKCKHKKICRWKCKHKNMTTRSYQTCGLKECGQMNENPNKPFPWSSHPPTQRNMASVHKWILNQPFQAATNPLRIDCAQMTTTRTSACSHPGGENCVQ